MAAILITWTHYKSVLWRLLFINLTLENQGLYIGSQYYHTTVDESLNSLEKYVELAFNLLCFIDRCIGKPSHVTPHLKKSLLNVQLLSLLMMISPPSKLGSVARGTFLAPMRPHHYLNQPTFTLRNSKNLYVYICYISCL
jgi:hypothetical protein